MTFYLCWGRAVGRKHIGFQLYRVMQRPSSLVWSSIWCETAQCVTVPGLGRGALQQPFCRWMWPKAMFCLAGWVCLTLQWCWLLVCFHRGRLRRSCCCSRVCGFLLPEHTFMCETWNLWLQGHNCITHWGCWESESVCLGLCMSKWVNLNFKMIRLQGW